MKVQKIHPADRPKLIVLAILTVFVFVYVFAVIVPQFFSTAHAGQISTASAPITVPAKATASLPAVAPPSAQSSVAPQTVASPVGPGRSGSVTLPEPHVIKVDENALITLPRELSRDPFTPFISSSGVRQIDANPVSTSPQPLGASRLAEAPGHVSASSPARSSESVGASIGAGTQAKTTGMPTAPVSAPSIELNGVISDTPAVAVLHIGDQTFDKSEGDSLPGNLVIVRITEAGVILRRDKVVLPLLEVGHTLEESKNPSAENKSEPAAKPCLAEADASAVARPVSAGVEIVATPQSPMVTPAKMVAMHPAPHLHQVLTHRHTRVRHRAVRRRRLVRHRRAIPHHKSR